MEQLLIAHDLGTSGDKATLFTTKGRQIRSFTVPYDVHFFNGNYAEQDPENWWDAVCDATKAVLEGEDPSRVAAMSFSAQMQGCLVVDKNGVPLRDAIIWADQRAVEEAEHLEKKIGAKRMYEITGHRVSPSYSIEKLMWLKKHEPAVYEKTYKMLQAKDYIISRATGKFVTDYSDASGTNALDLRKLQWSQEILKAAGIDEDKLPKLKKSTDIAGYIEDRVAGEIGLPAGRKSSDEQIDDRLLWVPGTSKGKAPQWVRLVSRTENSTSPLEPPPGLAEPPPIPLLMRTRYCSALPM